MFIFTHIEKSGGISLHTMLHDSFFNYFSPRPQVKGDFIYPTQLARLVGLWPFEISGIGGHKLCPALDYECTVDIGAQPIKYFTFLRNPIDRFLSHVNWQINIKGNSNSLDYYLEDGYFHNFQTYRIAQMRSFEKAREIVECKGMYLGLLERYNESLLLLKMHLNNDFSPVNVKMNDKSFSYASQFKREHLSSVILSKIREVNLEDFALYEYASNIFVQRLHGVDGDMNYTTTLKPLTNLKRKISNRLVTHLLGSER